MLVDPTNNFLYVAAQGTNQVFGFKINTTSGQLSALSPASQPTGSLPVALAMHPAINSAGQFLYVSNSASSNISGFAVSTTTGAMSNPTTVISPAGPSGMAAK
jgi:6-phosphogluconolactonase (cycloisomerase 2 family)